MKKLLLSLLMVLTAVGFANAADPLFTLQFGTNYNSNKVQNYTSSFNVTVNKGAENELVFTATAFNNNNNVWDYVRCGSNKAASTATISTNSAISAKMTSVVINAQKNSTGANDKVTTAKLLISSTSDFKNATEVDITSEINALTKTVDDITVTIPNPAANMLYQIEFVMPKTTGNGWLQINNVKWYGEDAADTRAEATLSFPEKTYSVNFGETFNAPEVTATPADAKAAVKYSVAPEGIVTIDENSGAITLANPNVAGTVTVTAAIPAGNETYRPASASYELTVVDPRQEVHMFFTSETCSVNFGEAVNAPELNVDPVTASSAVRYSVEPTGIVTVDETTGAVALVEPNVAGTVTVTAAITDNANYQDKSASYELTVKDPNALEVTFDFVTNDYGLTRGGDYNVKPTVITEAPVSVTLDGGNNRLWNGDGLRMYSGATATISVTSEYLLSGVTFTTNSDNSFKGTMSDDKKSFVIAYLPTSNQKSLNTITVKYVKAGDPAKEDPNVSFGENTTMTVPFEADKTVAGYNATAAEGLSIKYASGNTAVATVNETTGELTLVAPGTATITASTEETETYNAGYASYTLTVEKVFNSIKDILDYGENNETIDINFPMTVGAINGSNCYVADNNGGYILIYKQGSEIKKNVSDVIPAGWTAKYVVYNGLPELQFTNDLPASTETGEYVIETVAASEAMNQPLNKVFKIDLVRFAAATPANNANFTGTSENVELAFYNSLRLASVEADIYNVTVAANCFVSKQTEAADKATQLTPVEYTVIEAPAADVIAPKFTIGTSVADIKDNTIGTKGADVTVKFEPVEGYNIYYKVDYTTSGSDVSSVEEGFTLYNENEPIVIEKDKDGTFSYYAEDVKTGKNSPVTTYTLNSNDTTTGIGSIEADAEVEAVYDFNGRRVNGNLAPGMYIIVKGGKASKVIVK